jgi:ribosomal protein S18 acetylase RimI-like enzyme
MKNINSKLKMEIGVNMRNNINYKFLNPMDLCSDLLKSFDRYQVTNQVYYKDTEKEQYRLKYDQFVEQWDAEKKKQVIADLYRSITLNGFVAAAFLEVEMIGFANVEGETFGTLHSYRELTYIHVSNNFRNQGIGRKLFQLCCEKAKSKGTDKLYIAAHPSVETQHFYRSVGCVYAKEINQNILEREPLDIQLEYVL